MNIAEVTNKVNQLTLAWEDFKIVNDRRITDLEHKGHTNILDDEHLNRLNNAIDECKGRLNYIENFGSRPIFEKETQEKKNWFNNYLRKGTDKAMLETKSMTDDTSGIPLTNTIYDKIMVDLKNNSTMRQVASVDTISTDYITFFVPTNNIAASWGDAIASEDLPKVIQKQISTHILHACPTITRKLLDDAAIDIDQWITNNLIEAFSNSENQAFFNGNGANQPQGLLTKIETKTIVTSAPQLSIDDVISLFYSLNQRYAQNASFIMNRSTAHIIRSLKSDKTGQYIWQPGLQNNQDTLLGAPIYHSPEIPEAEPGNVAIIFGDFKRAYKIVDRAGIHILRDQFSYKPNIAFYASKRVGADVVDEKAMCFLKISAE